jgi:hypothetical protein
VLDMTTPSALDVRKSACWCQRGLAAALGFHIRPCFDRCIR